MDCIRCKERPAAVTCSCLRFNSQSDVVGADLISGTKTVRTFEYSAGAEEVGLCEKCLKMIGLREPKTRFPKLYTRFYLIWGALSVVVFTLLIITACSKTRVTSALGVVSLGGLFALLAALIIFEIAIRLAAANKRSGSDRLLIARATKYPYKRHFRSGLYVPLAADLYPDYPTFRRVNSEIMEDNAKKIYERIIAPGSKVSFGDEMKGAF